jgi:hypothetical protein
VVLEWAFRQFLKRDVGTSEVERSTHEPSGATHSSGEPRSGGGNDGEPMTFGTLGDLFAAAAPQSGPERALVVGFWLQAIEHSEDLEGARINSELTHLGYRLPNITTTMSLLMNQKPALVVQTKKTGSAQQARKRYRLTQAGIKRVEALIANAGSTP